MTTFKMESMLVASDRGSQHVILRPHVQEKWVYSFSEGNAQMRDLLGGKGAGLAEMVGIGLPVPPGFTITTEACNIFSATGTLPAELWAQVEDALQIIEYQSGRRFGDPERPLLVSVRSGAKFSMPGMMDTVLNIGLNDSTLCGLIAQSSNAHFAYDAYRRLIQMFGKVVLGISAEKFETVIAQHKTSCGVRNDAELRPNELEQIVAEFKAIVLHVLLSVSACALGLRLVQWSYNGHPGRASALPGPSER